jgi:hypothetical protein
MSDIKRYDLVDHFISDAQMELSQDHGKWVHFIAHEAAVKQAVAAERERCRKWILDIMGRREYSQCWYDDSDCGNWSACNPHCSLREMMDFAGIVPQDDGGLDKQPLSAVEKAQEANP